MHVNMEATATETGEQWIFPENEELEIRSVSL